MNYIGRLGFKSPVKTLLSSIQGKPYKKLALSNKWFSYRYGLLVLDVFHLHRSKMDIDLGHVFPDRNWEFVISKIYILMSNSVLCDSSNYSHILINKFVERCNDEAIKVPLFCSFHLLISSRIWSSRFFIVSPSTRRAFPSRLPIANSNSIKQQQTSL